MGASAATDVAVRDEPERSRYEVRVGGELAGFAEYRRRTRLIAFTHTLIDPRFEGGCSAWPRRGSRASSATSR